MNDIKEVADLIVKQGTAWEEYKKTNDKMLEAKADDKSVAEFKESLGKIEFDLTEVRKSMAEIEKKAGRPGMGADGEKSEDQIAHQKAFDRFLRKGIDGNLNELQQKAMNTGSDPDGGYLVLPEMESTIDRIAPTVSAMYRLADIKTISTAKWEKMVKTSGMAARRVADGSTGGETTNPKYAKISIEAHTGEAEPRVYNETLDDSMVNLAMDLAEEAAIAFAEMEGSEFITGNGVGGARGITAYTNVANASYSWGNVGYIASGKSGAFTSVAPADKVISLQHALKSQYRPGAVWLTNDATLGMMRQLKDGSGSYYLWQPDPSASFGGRFLGHTVEVDDNIADIAAGSYSLAFGNFKAAYAIVNRAGISLLRDPYTVKGQTLFNFRKRSGGGVKNFEAYKLMKFATS